jgi:hypothetical protein
MEAQVSHKECVMALPSVFVGLRWGSGDTVDFFKDINGVPEAVPF